MGSTADLVRVLRFEVPVVAVLAGSAEPRCEHVGQSVLLARRMVEAGVRFVNVHWPNVGGGANWDTHSNGFHRLKNHLLPLADRAVAALLDDLSDRGLLKQTLVMILTEFGRAPQIGKTFQNNGGVGGRDHWSNCFSVVLAGGGTPGGSVSLRTLIQIV